MVEKAEVCEAHCSKSALRNDLSGLAAYPGCHMINGTGGQHNAERHHHLEAVDLRPTRMLRFHELQQNPASAIFCDETGTRFTVVAERLRRGFVKLTCQCQHKSEAGWCKHCLAVLSDRGIFEDEQQRLAFEGIVAGTQLKAAAKRLNKALETFATAYRHMKLDLPVALDSDQLQSFAARAYEASVAANELGLALEAFIEEATR